MIYITLISIIIILLLNIIDYRRIIDMKTKDINELLDTIHLLSEQIKKNDTKKTLNMDFKELYKYFQEGISISVKSDCIDVGFQGDYQLFKKGNSIVTFIELGIEMEFNEEGKLISRKLIPLE